MSSVYKPKYSKEDVFGLVRLLILVILIFAFVVYAKTAAPEPVEPEPTDPEPTPEVTTAPVAEEPASPNKETTPDTTAAHESTEPPTETLPTAPPMEYTEKDLEYLALVVYQEAGGDECSDETRLMVANVVLNRVADDRFPDTIFDVIMQRSQYGRLHWTGPMWPTRRWDSREAEAVARAYAIAERVLQGERVLPDNVVFQSEYIQGTQIVAYSDGFYFCR